MSDAIRIVTNDAEHLGARSAAQARQDCEPVVFTTLSFLRRAALLTKNFVHDRANLQHEDLEPFCLSGGADTLAVIDTGIAFTSKKSSQHAVWVKLGALEYAPTHFGGEYQNSADFSTAYRTTTVRGDLEWCCESRDAEVALHLVDRLFTHLEGTKQLWLRELGLHAFQVQGQTGLTIVDKEPNQMSCTLRAKFTGNFALAVHHEGLPLSRIGVTLAT